MANATNMPLRATKCATCPFKGESPYSYLAQELINTQVGRICHSTGKDNAIHKRTGLPEHLCRGARDVYIQMLYDKGFLESPTDEAWDARRLELGMLPTVIQDPVKGKT